MANTIDRREFLALMGLGGAATTLSCGSQPEFKEEWKNWVEPVAGVIPYVPHYYATATRETGSAGLHVKVLGGRAVKLEGHPDHPINKGGLTGRQQSLIQGLYAEGRLFTPQERGKGQLTWRDLNERMRELLAANAGRTVMLTGPVSGAEKELFESFLTKYNGRHVVYEPYAQSFWVEASKKAFDQAKVPMISLEGTDMVVSLGAMFLESWGDVTAHSRHYGDMRAVTEGKRGKHVQFEARMSLTGSNADKVHYAKPGSKTSIALALLKEVAANSDKLTDAEKAQVAALVGNASLASAAADAGLQEDHLRKVVDDLASAQSAVVLPAERLELNGDSAAHHTAVLLLNKALGGIGKHYNYNAGIPEERTSSHQAIKDLAADLNGGNVGLLLIWGTNPGYSLPPELKWNDGLGKATVVAFADAQNETTEASDIIYPVNHALESWGEINTYEGLDMVCQPVMTPRWENLRQVHDVIVELVNDGSEDEAAPKNFRDFLIASWRVRFPGDDKAWRDTLRMGGSMVIAEGADLPLSGNLTPDVFANVGSASGNFTIIDSGRFGDGSTTDRGWMQEQPDPMAGLVWDSWLEVSQEFADANGITYKNGATGGKATEVTVSVSGRGEVTIPAYITETCSNNVMILETGQGHTSLTEKYNRGANAFSFLSAELDDAGLFTAGSMTATVTKTGETYRTATLHLQGVGDQVVTKHTLLKKHKVKRDLFQWTDLDEMAHGDDHGHHGDGVHLGGHYETVDYESTFPLSTDKNWYPDRDDDPVYKDNFNDETFYDPYKWEMALDLNRCTGCGSCVTACYAENNLPVVGKDQVARGREMAWIRINRYLRHTGENHDNVKVAMLPMMCQQCGNAPCESVCPSLATYHSRDGLNAMVYNRCVGTRYCANNCSYKVRRFNWFTFDWEGDLNWALNPAVSVRHKGVMEKCTFCVQRIRDGKDLAHRDEDRQVKDGDIMTACQQACPSKAITFGNAKDKDSEVYKWSHDGRAYRALDSHIHTKPGISYLKRVELHADSDENHG